MFYPQDKDVTDVQVPVVYDLWENIEGVKPKGWDRLSSQHWNVLRGEGESKWWSRLHTYVLHYSRSLQSVPFLTNLGMTRPLNLHYMEVLLSLF